MLIRGPVGVDVLGIECSHVRGHEPPITTRSPWCCVNRRAAPPPRGRRASVRVAPTLTIATMVSWLAPRPMVSPCQATLSPPWRYRHNPTVVNGSPSSPA